MAILEISFNVASLCEWKLDQILLHPLVAAMVSEVKPGPPQLLPSIEQAGHELPSIEQAGHELQSWKGIVKGSGHYR